MLKETFRRVATWSVNNMPDWQREYMVVQREWGRVVGRDDKYDKIVFYLNLADYFNPIFRFIPGRPRGVAPGATNAYFFCRFIDDVSDGDRKLPPEYSSFSEMCEDLKESMETGNYPGTDIGMLLKGFVRDMADFRGVDMRQDAGRFLDAMEVEYDRRINRTVSTQAELAEIYENSFRMPQDAAFIGFGSKVRTDNVPELTQLQGRIYAVRDLASEMSRGIIFVPREVVDSLGLDYSTPYDTYSDWISSELEVGRDLAARLGERKLDFWGRTIVNSLTKGIEHVLEGDLKAA